jgi:hypothetical protein
MSATGVAAALCSIAMVAGEGVGEALLSGARRQAITDRRRPSAKTARIGFIAEKVSRGIMPRDVSIASPPVP